ncbi:MAG: aldo/keto reductase [Planctomycetota bacterium]
MRRTTDLGRFSILVAAAAAALGAAGERRASEAKALFDGKSLAGWRRANEPGHGSGCRWEVRGGAISGFQDYPGAWGILVTEAKFGDFELALEVKAGAPFDAGVIARATPEGHGYLIAIRPGPGGDVGGVSASRIGDVRFPPADWKAVWREGWNELRIDVRGHPPEIRTWLNGRPMAEAKGLPVDPRVGPSGHIALKENRTQVMARCLESGFNYVDACWTGEVEVYARALAKLGKRKQIYFGFDSHGSRGAEFRTRQALLADLETTMRENGLDCVDLWRITCHEPGGLHTHNEACEFAAAGEKAVKDGKARFFGLSTHDRRWADFVVREFPIVSVIITPYTPGTNELAHASFFDTARKHDVGILGIKPFASNALFRGSSQPGDPYEKADDEAARLALRHVLRNDAITAPIPGLIFPSHVDNCLRAIEERRKFDLAARPAIDGDRRYAGAVSAMWGRLPAEYAWLRDWEWV